MVTLAVWVGAVFVAGLLAVLLRLPPLVGFLVAGFALNAAGVEELAALDVVADLGVTLLLFSIGLKLDPRLLIRREVWGTAAAHLVLVTALAMGFLAVLGLVGVPLLAGSGWVTLLLLAFALSFSSTVFVIKVLDDRSEAQSLYGRIAIGILIIQDLAAVAFIAATSGEPLSPWSPLLVLLVLAVRPIRMVWARLGHGEMQTVFGVFMALVPGYALFEALNLKGELGALLMGVLLSGAPRASELSRSLMSVKDLLLVGFFVSIGYSGDLSWQAVGVGALLLCLLPAQSFLYMWLLRMGPAAPAYGGAGGSGAGQPLRVRPDRGRRRRLVGVAGGRVAGGALGRGRRELRRGVAAQQPHLEPGPADHSAAAAAGPSVTPPRRPAHRPAGGPGAGDGDGQGGGVGLPPAAGQARAGHARGGDQPGPGGAAAAPRPRRRGG